MAASMAAAVAAVGGAELVAARVVQASVTSAHREWREAEAV